MRKTTPVEEFNIKEIRSNLEKKQTEIASKVFEESREHIIKKMGDISLYDISNHTEKGYNRPYLVDFGFIMDRLQNDLKVDQNYESIQVKLDITEQLEKMKKLPSLKTECHIESNKVGRSTGIISFIRKFIFRDRKYKVIFHDKEAKFEKECYEINNIPFRIIFCFLLAIFIFSIVFRNGCLSLVSIISLICLCIIWFNCL